MRKNIKSIAALLFTGVILAGAFTACGAASDDSKSTTENTSTEAAAATATEVPAATDTTDTTGSELSGTITMAGSTSMEKLANAAAESFMVKYPNVSVSAEFTGSSAGIEAVQAGTADIGNASRSLKDTEISAGLVENIVAIDGIAVVLDPANTVDNLTKDQLVQIYKGEIRNWSEVGGTDEPIVVIGRESGSGTRDAFEELLEIADLCKYSNEINSTGGVMAKVASTPGAIGYVSLDIVDDSVVAANIDGVAPTEENIKAGTYLLNRPFVMATVGEISAQNEVVQAFFEYLQSDEGKTLIKSVGLITVD